MKDPQHCPPDLLKETRQLPSSGELSQRTIMPSPKLAQGSTQCPMKLSVSKWNMVLIFGKQYFDWKTFRDFLVLFPSLYISKSLLMSLYFPVTWKRISKKGRSGLALQVNIVPLCCEVWGKWVESCRPDYGFLGSTTWLGLWLEQDTWPFWALTSNCEIEKSHTYPIKFCEN